MPRVRPIGQAEQIAYRIPAKVHGVGTPIDVYVLAVVRKLNDVAARIRLSRAVAFWPVQTAVARVVRYGVRRSGTGLLARMLAFLPTGTGLQCE